MKSAKTDIWVYAHWEGMEFPQCIGILSAQKAKGRKSFSFEYDENWINSTTQLLLDPDINWYKGTQYPNAKDNFGLFMDSMPDNWGKKLMDKKAAQVARELEKRVSVLYEVDYLLGVFDQSRMGALRFKLDPNGPFLDNTDKATPHWSSIRELQHAAAMIEEDVDLNDMGKWLSVLVAPGSSLGGARPKANILDDEGHPWIAKFPSQNDKIDKGVWEYLVYALAVKVGINMADSKIEKIGNHKHHTFFTKRFDRLNSERIHFASAMTMTGNTEERLRDTSASYLEMAEFIQNYGLNFIQADLHQLWKRIVFNIAVSNTDDHLRNHGFIIKDNEWRLSPAYDINASIEKNELSLNIDAHDNSLNLNLAKSVGPYFQLNNEVMDDMIKEIGTVVKDWKITAEKIGINRVEQEYMSGAFFQFDYE